MEEWKAVVGYEGYYEVSNYGRVKGLNRTIQRSDGRMVTIPERILSPVLDTDGYRQCKLCRDGKYKTVGVHCLVARAFIPNPDNLEDVNHKNFNRADNHVSNLEWKTHGDNVRYSIEAKRHFCTRDLTGANNPNYKNDTLKNFYAEHPEERMKLARPRGQNGRAKKVMMIDPVSEKIIGKFSCLLDCAEGAIQYLGISLCPKSLTYNISLAAKNGGLYKGLKFQYC